MSIDEMVRKYGITLELKTENGVTTPTGRIGIGRAYSRASDTDKEEVKARKKEIYDYLLAQRTEHEATAEERRRKIAAIAGLEELRRAKFELAEWDRKFKSSFDGEDAVGGLGVGPRPKVDIDALEAKYPRAAAYMQAEAWSLADNYVKSGAGRDAMEKIINGDNYPAAIAEMERTWAEYVNENIWD